MATFFYCDHDLGPCIVSEQALSKMKADPARCLAHGSIIGGILRDCADRDDARRKLGVPFRKLYGDRRPYRLVQP
jgi:hypothetical protein